MPEDHPDISDAAGLRIDALVALEPGCTYRRVAESWGRQSANLCTVEVGSYHVILATGMCRTLKVLDAGHFALDTAADQLAHLVGGFMK
jgi:hypothetical protein